MTFKSQTARILVSILAAAFLLSGCTNETANPASEKGTWQQDLFTVTKTETPADHDYFSTNVADQTITFHFDASDYAVAGTYFNDIDGVDDQGSVAEEEKIKAKYFRFTPLTDDTLVGFEANVTVEQGNATTLWGFDFCNSTDSETNTKSYYTLLIHNKQYMLKYSYYNGTEWTFSTPLGWTTSSAFKDTGTQNTVKVATRNDGKVNISVNGTLLKTIMLSSDAFTHGKISAIGGIHHDDVQSGADPVKVTWKFTKFQHP